MEITGGPSRPVHEGLECWVALNSEQVDALFAEGAKPDVYWYTLRDSGFVVRPLRHLGEPLSSWPGDHVARVKSQIRRALSSAVSSYQLRAI